MRIASFHVVDSMLNVFLNHVTSDSSFEVIDSVGDDLLRHWRRTGVLIRRRLRPHFNSPAQLELLRRTV